MDKTYTLNEEQVLAMQEIKSMQRAAYYLAEASTVTKIPIHELMEHIANMALIHVNQIRKLPEPKPPKK